MFRNILVLMLVAILSLAGCASKGNQDADIAAIKGTMSKYSETLMASDADGWMALWDQNGVQLPPDEPIHVGIAEIRTANYDWVKTYNSKMAISPREVVVAGDWAFVSCLYTLEFAPKSGGPGGSVDGKALSILKRQSDKSWKFYRDCFNSNVPPK
jgi:ketosteroid isomerase-like protein